MGRYNKSAKIEKKVPKNIEKEPLLAKEEIKYSRKSITYLVILLFAFAFYGNTVLNDYALDDAIVITQNDFTLKGVNGIKDIFSTELFTGFFKVKKDLVVGGRYRPLSLATFAMEVEIFGQNPYISHLINVLLFGLIGILLYEILLRLFKKYKTKDIWYLNLPLIVSLLYLAHPIHTEVVANIKGRDELLSLLGVFIAFLYTLKYLETKKTKFLLFSFLGFLGSMFSKEIGVTFLLTIPLAIWFFTDSKWKKHFCFPTTFISFYFFIFYGQRCCIGRSDCESDS